MAQAKPRVGRYSSTLNETPSNELDLPDGEPLVNGQRDDDEDDSSSLCSEEGASAISSVFTLCNSCIGAGVLSLPFAFMKAGDLLPNKRANSTSPELEKVDLVLNQGAMFVSRAKVNSTISGAI